MTYEQRKKRIAELKPLKGRGRTAKDLTGLSLGGCAVTRPSPNQNTPAQVTWKCRCACGTEFQHAAKDLLKSYYRYGTVYCSRKCPLIPRPHRTHRLSKHPAYAVYQAMLGRCLNPKHHAYRNYGGRGITVCEAWSESFDAFWRDLGPTYIRGLTLERRDNSKGYTPDNCAWATWTQQARNRRRNRRIWTPWGTMPLSEAVQRSGVSYTTLARRIDNNWPMNDWFLPASTLPRSKRHLCTTS
jgi:hypothetical protein